MKHLIWLSTLIILTSGISALAIEVRPLADCTVKVYREINRSHAWSGKAPVGCLAKIHVEKRPAGIFIIAWNNGRSDSRWDRISFSAAMGFKEIADRKTLEKAGHDITARAARLEHCLDSIIRVNDPLECRDYATKTYSAGDEMGIEFKRNIWLNDNGRHSVVEYAYGDTREADSPPAELFGGVALPPGTNLNIHIFNTD